MDPLDPVRERHERGEIFPVYLVIPRQDVVDQCAGLLRHVGLRGGFGKVFHRGPFPLARRPVLAWAAANWYL